jgi:hypothetical protein
LIFRLVAHWPAFRVRGELDIVFGGPLDPAAWNIFSCRVRRVVGEERQPQRFPTAWVAGAPVGNIAGSMVLLRSVPQVDPTVRAAVAGDVVRAERELTTSAQCRADRGTILLLPILPTTLIPPLDALVVVIATICLNVVNSWLRSSRPITVSFLGPGALTLRAAAAATRTLNA